MRTKLTVAACALALAALSTAVRAADDLVSGLVGEYFALEEVPGDFPKIPATKKPYYVRVEKTVDFDDAPDDFHGIKLSENFYARWTGTLRVDKAGSYQFITDSDDGSRLSINGKVVVDNGGVHAMQEASGKIDLTPGDHAILIEFFEAGGGAGCKVAWHPPGGKREVLSEKALFHKKEAENIDWDKSAWGSKPKPATPAKGGAPAAKKRSNDKMNYGPFHTANVEANYPEKGNVTLKGMAIKLTKETTQVLPAEGQTPKMAAVCFDQDMLRMSLGWTGGYLSLPTGRDGLEGHPYVEGTPVFGAKKTSIGWWKGDESKDPRPKPYGPLPHEFARYKGAYLHEGKTILSYTVATNPILELPGFEFKDGLDIITRSFSIAKTNTALTALIGEEDKLEGTVEDGVAVLNKADNVIAAALSGAPEGAKLEVAGSRIQLRLPPLNAAAKFTVSVWSGPKADLAKFKSAAKSIAAPDVEALTKGGPPRWTPAITLKGTVSENTQGYVADEITVPYENPWDAYMRITGIDFFSDPTKAAVSTMSGDVWLISGIDEKLENITWKRYATGLFQTLGLKIVDDKVYALERGQITRFHDLNNDGEADFYEAFNNDGMIGPNQYHEFAHDLHTDKDGNFYFVRGSNLGAGGTPHNGVMCRVSKDGSKMDVVCVGFRAPNGMGLGPDGQLTTGDNQGNWVPGSPINWMYAPDSPLIKKDELGFYGFRLDHYPYTKQGPRLNPLVWIPYNMDNSCGGQVWATSDKWGPFNGNLLHMSYGKCVLFNVMKQKVGDEVQGAVVKFPINFISGIMRARFNKGDGQLYVVGMRGWQTSANKAGCVTRVRYTGKPVKLPNAWEVTKTGIDIGFTDTVDPASAGDVQNYGAEWFHIEYTGGYGSPEFTIADKKKKGKEALTIKSVKVSPDGKKVSLEIPGLAPVTNIVIKYKINAADGSVMQHEVAGTINKMP
jgi:hypothetical protein